MDFTPERIRDVISNIVPHPAETTVEMMAGSVPKSRYVAPQVKAQSARIEVALFLPIERIIDGIDEIARHAAASSQNSGS
jgi:hypothetical protein